MKKDGLGAEEQRSFYVYCIDGAEETVARVQKIIDRYDEYLGGYVEFKKQSTGFDV